MSFSSHKVVILDQDFSFIHFFFNIEISDFRPQEETRKPGATIKTKREE